MGSLYNATSLTQLANLAAPPILSVGLTEVSMARSISSVMYNATDTEKQSQTIQNAAVAQCCALMVSAGAAGATKPPK